MFLKKSYQDKQKKNPVFVYSGLRNARKIFFYEKSLFHYKTRFAIKKTIKALGSFQFFFSEKFL